MDKNVFFEKTMPALLSQMIALRKKVLVKLRGDMLDGVDVYPLNEALIGVEDYFFAGTIPGAISAIVEEAGANSRKADEDLKVVVVEKRAGEFLEGERQNRVKQIIIDIDGLSDANAIALNKNPPVKDPTIDKIVKLRDPTDRRFTDGGVARSMLKMIAAVGKRKDENLDAWEAALKVP